MKSLLLILITFHFLINNSISAQFIISSSNPSNGDAGVQLTTIVSFSFSMPIDTSMRYGEFQYPIGLVEVSPSDSVNIGTVSFSSDLKTISFEAIHKANTDFLWLITGAKSNSGEQLSQPTVLFYSTAPSVGSHSVSGTITYNGQSPVNSLAALFDKPLFTEDEPSVKIGTVVTNASGEFTINHVRDGIYFPMAAKDANNNGIIDLNENDLIGYYDFNGDGKHDSIVVSGGNISGINISLRQLFVPVKARSYLDSALSIAKMYANDQELRAIIANADTIGLDGTSVFWMYYFYSPSSKLSTSILLSSIFSQVDTSNENDPMLPLNIKAIPLNFIDSDIGIANAELYGGKEFRAQHNIVRRSIWGGNLYWGFPIDSTKIFWWVEYEAIESDSSHVIFRAFTDILSGDYLGDGFTDVQNTRNQPVDFELFQNYPNPFNPNTTIAYALPLESKVKIEIYNILGQLVERLVDKVESAGYKSILWNPHNLSSGIYIMVLNAEVVEGGNKFYSLRKLILLK